METIKELEDLVDIVLEGVKYSDDVSNDVYIYNAVHSVCAEIYGAAMNIVDKIKHSIHNKTYETFDLGRFKLDFPNEPTIVFRAHCYPAEDSITNAEAGHAFPSPNGYLVADINLYYPNAYKQGLLIRHLHHEIMHVIDSLAQRHRIQSAQEWSGLQKSVTAPASRRQLKSMLGDEPTDEQGGPAYWNQPSEVNARLHGFISAVGNKLISKGIFKIDIHKLLNGEYGNDVTEEVNHLFHKVVPENRRRIIKRLGSLIDDMNEKLVKLRK